MSAATQMSLLAQPSDAPLEVPISPSVLLYGARARTDRGRGEPLFAHRHVPSPPPKLPDEREWLIALDFAESARRYNQAGRAVLDLNERGGAGSNGPMGAGRRGGPLMMASSRGLDVDGRLAATWPQMLRGRQEQRELESDVARARDLAEAYHYLDYYGRVYDEPEEGDTWSPIPLIRRLAEEARELGGHPAQLKTHTAYMRDGIALGIPDAGESADGWQE